VMCATVDAPCEGALQTSAAANASPVENFVIGYPSYLQ
jgi:hypothetical protein